MIRLQNETELGALVLSSTKGGNEHEGKGLAADAACGAAAGGIDLCAGNGGVCGGYHCFPGTCGEHTAWTLDSDGVLTVTGTGEMNCFMMSPHAPWEEERDKIRSVVIEDGVTSIGKSAFPDCKNLTSVTIPDSVTVIGRYAFEHCGALGDVTLPDSVTSIGEHAFEGCVSMKNIKLSESLTEVGNMRFRTARG